MYGQQPYGATQPLGAYQGKGTSQFDREPAGHFSWLGITACLVLPTVFYVFISHVRGFSIHYDQPALCHLIAVIAWVAVAYFFYVAYKAYRRGDSILYTFFAFAAFFALVSALIGGDLNFSQNMRPYYDVQSLNVYPSIDVMTARGQQYMDAGRMVFSNFARLDLSMSMGFKNYDTYCVAPIVSGNGSLPVYDFWAVGINCCSGHVADFSCGEFSNPRAVSGLRLMRDDQRAYFRLAVQQAESSYNIKATHPLFLYWLQDPIAEMNAYQDAGARHHISGCFIFFACLAGSLLLVVLAMHKKGY